MGCTIPNIPDNNEDDMLEVNKSWIQNKPFDNHINLYVLTIFCLWEILKCRNENVFNNLNVYPLFGNVYAATIEYTHLSNTHQSQVSQIISISIKWSPPTQGFYKLIVDGSSIGIGGIRGTIRNDKGDWILGVL